MRSLYSLPPISARTSTLPALGQIGRDDFGLFVSMGLVRAAAAAQAVASMALKPTRTVERQALIERTVDWLFILARRRRCGVTWKRRKRETV